MGGRWKRAFARRSKGDRADSLVCPGALWLCLPPVYSLVSFKGTVQAECTTAGLTGNFGDVAKLLVKKLPSQTNSKLSYIYDEYFFHYIVDAQWIYLCICDKKFQRMLAFQFLNDLAAFVKSRCSGADRGRGCGAEARR